MIDANRTGRPPFPEGLLEALAAPPATDRIELAREHVRLRAFDDVLVVEEIALHLLALSAAP